MITIPDTPRDQALPSTKLLARLHAGPNLRRTVNSAYADELPSTWSLSWGRVSPVALVADTEWLTRIAVDAFDEFERACAQLWQLARSELPWQGEYAPRSGQLGDRAPWSVRRLDIVVGAKGAIRVVENDEMPGGVLHAYFLDMAYGTNHRRWQQAIKWLTAEGPLVFVVSNEWSTPYIPEIKWLVEHWRDLGYQADMVTTDQLDRLETWPDGVYLNGQRVGTLWRLFPWFEMDEALRVIDDVARRGHVRLVPELTTWGDKTWFGLFWQYNDFFRRAMSEESFELLCKVLPKAALIVDGHLMSPINVINGKGKTTVISEVGQLFNLEGAERNSLVVKVCGANQRSTRSQGVTLGVGRSRKQWQEQLRELLGLGETLLVQHFFDPEPMRLPVGSVLNGPIRPEPDFMARVLLRPWVIGGKLVSCTAFCGPQETRRLHGSTWGCEVPADLGVS